MEFSRFLAAEISDARPVVTDKEENSVVPIREFLAARAKDKPREGEHVVGNLLELVDRLNEA